MEAPSLHMVMGVEEATIVGTAIGLLLAHIDQDIQNVDGSDTDEMLEMLSTKLLATNMFTHLWETMGVPRDELERLLDKMGERGE
jgi:hypothetical protein